MDRAKQRHSIIGFEFEPVPLPVSGSNASIVSSRPPVARTTGTVPYFKL